MTANQADPGPETIGQDVGSRFDHAGMEVLSRQACLRRLHDQTVGRIGVVDEEGLAVILPLKYRFRHGRIFFLSAGGTKLNAATNGSRVTFQIDGWDPELDGGWSVLVRGTCTPVPEQDIALAAETGLQPGLRTMRRTPRWVQILPDEITGRRLPGGQMAPNWD